MLVGETTQTLQTLVVGSGLFGNLLKRGSPPSSSSSSSTTHADTMAMNVHVEKGVSDGNAVIDNGYYPRKGHGYQKTRLSKPVMVRTWWHCVVETSWVRY